MRLRGGSSTFSFRRERSATELLLPATWSNSTAHGAAATVLPAAIIASARSCGKTSKSSRMSSVRCRRAGSTFAPSAPNQIADWAIWRATAVGAGSRRTGGDKGSGGERLSGTRGTSESGYVPFLFSFVTGVGSSQHIDRGRAAACGDGCQFADISAIMTNGGWRRYAGQSTWGWNVQRRTKPAL